MKKSIIIIGLICLFLIGSFFIGKYYGKQSEKTIIKDTIAPQIEQIIVKNDSLLRINDSINFKVIEIEHTYEKTVDDIIRNNPYDDYNFFSTYIERYCGHDYSDTTQNSESNIR